MDLPALFLSSLLNMVQVLCQEKHTIRTAKGTVGKDIAAAISAEKQLFLSLPQMKQMFSFGKQWPDKHLVV